MSDEWKVGDLVDVRLQDPLRGEIWQQARIVSVDGNVVAIDFDHDFRIVDKIDLRWRRATMPPWMMGPS